METLNWHGLDSDTFKVYRSWKNNQSVGICGTYCAAVLTHYITKRDTGISLNKEILINGLKKPIDQLTPHKGSFYWNIREALNYILQPTEYIAHSGWWTERDVPQLITDDKGPVIVGTLQILGSSYKNHWLVVYAYAFDATGKLWFKGYDNHGRHDAVIPASETFSYVYLENHLPDIMAGKEVTVLHQQSVPGVTMLTNNKRKK